MSALLALLTSGAGGGIIGGILGLFKQSQERKERVEMARIEQARDQMEYENAAAEREHALLMLDKTGEIELGKIQSETEAEIEVAHQAALSSAQDALKGLNTSTAMDNFRASVRPALAYGFSIIFSIMLAWTFWKFSDTIDAAAGHELLLGMFGTLTFLVTSIGTFYYVARRNPAPRV